MMIDIDSFAKDSESGIHRFKYVFRGDIVRVLGKDGAETEMPAEDLTEASLREYRIVAVYLRYFDKWATTDKVAVS